MTIYYYYYYYHYYYYYYYYYSYYSYCYYYYYYMIAMISNFRSPVILKPKPVPVPSLNCYKPIFYAGARVYVWGGGPSALHPRQLLK